MKLHLIVVCAVCVVIASATRNTDDNVKKEKHSPSSKITVVKDKRDAGLELQQSPTSGYLPPQTSYGVPQTTYGASQSPFSHNTYLPPQVNSPHNAYGPPQIGAPQGTYGPPSISGPQHNYGPPQFGAPQSTYGPPQFNVPQGVYGPPQQSYGIPAQIYGPPGQYGPSQSQIFHPSQSYGQPSGIGGPQIAFGVPQVGGLHGLGGLNGWPGAGGPGNQGIQGIQGGPSSGFGGLFSGFRNPGASGGGFGSGLTSGFSNAFSNIGSGLSNLGSTFGLNSFNPLSNLYGSQSNSNQHQSGSYYPSRANQPESPPAYAAGHRGLSHFSTGAGSSVLSSSPLGLPLPLTRTHSFISSHPTALTESSLQYSGKEAFRPSEFLGASSPGLQLSSLDIASNKYLPPGNTYLPAQQPGNTYLPPSNTYLPSKPSSTYGAPLNTLTQLQYEPQSSGDYGTLLHHSEWTNIRNTFWFWINFFRSCRPNSKVYIYYKKTVRVECIDDNNHNWKRDKQMRFPEILMF